VSRITDAAISRFNDFSVPSKNSVGAIGAGLADCDKIFGELRFADSERTKDETPLQVMKIPFLRMTLHENEQQN
jgi:hypothetical protein